eukprot:1136978-Pelagomonas_calceolata.AAC.4
MSSYIWSTWPSLSRVCVWYGGQAAQCGEDSLHAGFLLLLAWCICLAHVSELLAAACAYVWASWKAECVSWDTVSATLRHSVCHTEAQQPRLNWWTYVGTALLSVKSEERAPRTLPCNHSFLFFVPHPLSEQAIDGGFNS